MIFLLFFCSTARSHRFKWIWMNVSHTPCSVYNAYHVQTFNYNHFLLGWKCHLIRKLKEIYFSFNFFFLRPFLRLLIFNLNIYLMICNSISLLYSMNSVWMYWRGAGQQQNLLTMCANFISGNYNGIAKIYLLFWENECSLGYNTVSNEIAHRTHCDCLWFYIE